MKRWLVLFLYCTLFMFYSIFNRCFIKFLEAIRSMCHVSMSKIQAFKSHDRNGTNKIKETEKIPGLFYFFSVLFCSVDIFTFISVYNCLFISFGLRIYALHSLFFNKIKIFHFWYPIVTFALVIIKHSKNV